MDRPGRAKPRLRRVHGPSGRSRFGQARPRGVLLPRLRRLDRGPAGEGPAQHRGPAGARAERSRLLDLPAWHGPGGTAVLRAARAGRDAPDGSGPAHSRRPRRRRDRRGARHTSPLVRHAPLRRSALGARARAPLLPRNERADDREPGAVAARGGALRHRLRALAGASRRSRSAPARARRRPRARPGHGRPSDHRARRARDLRAASRAARRNPRRRGGWRGPAARLQLARVRRPARAGLRDEALRYPAPDRPLRASPLSLARTARLFALPLLCVRRARARVAVARRGRASSSLALARLARDRGPLRVVRGVVGRTRLRRTVPR